MDFCYLLMNGKQQETSQRPPPRQKRYKSPVTPQSLLLQFGITHKCSLIKGPLRPTHPSDLGTTAVTATDPNHLNRTEASSTEEGRCKLIALGIKERPRLTCKDQRGAHKGHKGQKPCIHKCLTLKDKGNNYPQAGSWRYFMFNTSEKNAYTKNLDMKKQWFNTNELTRNWSLGRWRRFPKS